MQADNLGEGLRALPLSFAECGDELVKQVHDVMGAVLQVGDTVLYSTRRGELRKATVSEINPRQAIPGWCAVIRTENGQVVYGNAPLQMIRVEVKGV